MPSIVDISDVSDDALNLKNLMDGVLERVENIYLSFGIPLPDRRYWLFGEPAIDCEQLVVSFVQMYLGTPGDEAATPQRCNVPRSVVLSISVARAVPVVSASGKAPDPKKIEEAAHIAAIDCWILLETVRSLDMWDEFGGGVGPGVIATVETPTISGGYQQCTMQITMVVP